MKPFGHGGDIYAFAHPVLDFSASLNPLGLPEGVRQAIRSVADAPCHYPDPFCRELVGEIARCEQIPEEWVLCGNGAADFIYRLVWAVKPERALLLSPCFSEYEAALRTVGAQVLYHSLLWKESFTLTPRVLSDLTPELDCIFLCNPNNPTGLPVDPELLLQILRQARRAGILVVLDECFVDLLDDPGSYTAKAWLSEFPNLILLKAFTKTYAMAGLRLGYGLCSDRRLMQKIQQYGQPWPVSSVAQAAGVAALSDPGYLEKSRSVLHPEREFLKSGLTQCGFSVWDSKANYVFFRAWRGLREALLQKHILIRCCGDYRGLDDSFYRVAVRLHPDNHQLLSALQERRDSHEWGQ